MLNRNQKETIVIDPTKPKRKDTQYITGMLDDATRFSPASSPVYYTTDQEYSVSIYSDDGVQQSKIRLQYAIIESHDKANVYVVSDDSVPDLVQSRLQGVKVSKVSGELNTYQHPCIYIPKEDMYFIDGVVDFNLPWDRNTKLTFARLLREFQAVAGENYFSQGRHDCVIVHSNQKWHLSLDFKHPVICYRKGNGGHGYLMPGETFAAGSYSKVAKEQKRLVLRTDNQVEMLDNRYVVKTEDYVERHNYDLKQEISRRTPYLHAKKPVRLRCSVIGIERLMPGVELQEIIEREQFIVATKLQTAKRITLSIEMLYAMHEQVHKRGVVHRDVKPPNLLVDVNRSIVRYIDFNLSKKEEVKNDGNEHSGTPLYSSYETINRMPQSAASDVYSLGLVIAEFWGVDRDYIKYEDQLREFVSSPTYPDLFCVDNYSDKPLAKTERAALKDLIIRMTLPSHSARPGLDFAIYQFEQIRLAYCLSISPAEQHENIKLAHKAACILRHELYTEMRVHSFMPVTFEDVSKLMARITQAVDALQDTPEVLQIFTDTLGIVAFRDITTVEGIKQKVTELLPKYFKEIVELANMDMLAHGAFVEGQEGTPAQQEIAKQILETTAYLRDKCNKTLFTFDELADLTTRLACKRVSLLKQLEYDFNACIAPSQALTAGQ